MASSNRRPAGEGSQRHASRDYLPLPIFEALERRLLLDAVLFGSQQVITTDAANARIFYAADLDGDDDMDLLSATTYGSIEWYENIDGPGTLGPRQRITEDVDFVHSIYVADIDGDGDMDVLSASWDDHKIAWYENLDGAGSFGCQHVITAAAYHAASVHAADVDGDGDMDVLSASFYDDKITWYENTDGAG
ncbi:MAG: VCBS repeat-containing protein, partial [Planctomycetes bacterium]|nr:VCBS repeat-containing protein [Planctomycetota bacterium]